MNGKNPKKRTTKKPQTVPCNPWGLKIYSTAVSGGEQAGQDEMFDTRQHINTKPSAWSTFINTRPRLDPLREWKSCIKFRL